MKNNKIYIYVLLIIVIISIAGLLSYQFMGDKNDNSIKIGFLVPTLKNQFFVDMTESAKGMETEIVKVYIQASENELVQNQIIENFITQGVDAICVVPINSESVIPAIIKANAASIPIINIDNKINMESAEEQGAKIAFYIGSDNYEGGQAAGRFILEKLSRKGKIAILEGVAGNDAAIKRKGGFLDAIKDSDEIRVIASQVADWDRQKAKDVFSAILTAHEDLNAVFACNDEMALGVIAALKSKNISLDNIIVVGFDAIDEAINAINKGELDASIAQQPKLMGMKAIELSLMFIDGEQINKEYSTPLKVINNNE